MSLLGPCFTITPVYPHPVIVVRPSRWPQTPPEQIKAQFEKVPGVRAVRDRQLGGYFVAVGLDVEPDTSECRAVIGAVQAVVDTIT